MNKKLIKPLHLKQKTHKKDSRGPSLRIHSEKQLEKPNRKVWSRVERRKSVSKHLAEIERYKTELEKYKKEIEQYKQRFLYLKADFDNYKKRNLMERSDLLKYGSEALAVEILEVVDTFEQALSLKINPKNVQSFADGIKMVYSAFMTTLKKQGVEELAVLGKPFDPHVCNALGKEQTSDVAPEHVSQVIKKPYKLHEKIIRCGQVIVAQASPKSSLKKEG